MGFNPGKLFADCEQKASDAFAASNQTSRSSSTTRPWWMEYMGSRFSRRHPPCNCTFPPPSTFLHLQEFLDSGLTPESADRAGYTAIHAAASYGHLPLLRFLVKERNGDINVQDVEGDTPLHMCELVEVAREMIQELGADVTIKNKEDMTAAEAVREEGDFDELADYLESVTPGVTARNTDTSALAYTEFRERDDDDEDREEESLEAVIPADAAGRIDEIIRLEQTDGVNRDEELRSIVTEAIMRQMGRGQNGNGNNTTRRPRREADE